VYYNGPWSNLVLERRGLRADHLPKMNKRNLTYERMSSHSGYYVPYNCRGRMLWIATLTADEMPSCTMQNIPAQNEGRTLLQVLVSLGHLRKSHGKGYKLSYVLQCRQTRHTSMFEPCQYFFQKESTYFLCLPIKNFFRGVVCNVSNLRGFFNFTKI